MTVKTKINVNRSVIFIGVNFQTYLCGAALLQICRSVYEGKDIYIDKYSFDS